MGILRAIFGGGDRKPRRRRARPAPIVPMPDPEDVETPEERTVREFREWYESLPLDLRTEFDRVVEEHEVMLLEDLAAIAEGGVGDWEAAFWGVANTAAIAHRPDLAQAIAQWGLAQPAFNVVHRHLFLVGWREAMFMAERWREVMEPARLDFEIMPDLIKADALFSQNSEDVWMDTVQACVKIRDMPLLVSLTRHAIERKCVTKIYAREVLRETIRELNDEYDEESLGAELRDIAKHEDLLR